MGLALMYLKWWSSELNVKLFIFSFLIAHAHCPLLPLRAKHHHKPHPALFSYAGNFLRP